MIFQTALIVIVYRVLVTAFPFFYFSLSFLWASFAYYDTHQRNSFKKLKTEDANFENLKFIESLAQFGVFWGVVVIIAALLVLIVNIIPTTLDISPDLFMIITSIVLIISGVLTIIKPIQELPTLTLIGLIISSVSSIFILMFIPDSLVSLIYGRISPKDVLLGFSVGYLLIVIGLGVFYTHGLTTVAKALSWPPVASIVSLFCVFFGIIIFSLYFF